MKNRAIWFCNSFLIVILISLPVWQMIALGETGATAAADTADFANKRIDKLQRSAESFRELANQPIPAKLSEKERKKRSREAYEVVERL
jgi:hypothetical protein